LNAFQKNCRSDKSPLSFRTLDGSQLSWQCLSTSIKQMGSGQGAR
jgi:hypothetical protein